MLIMRNLICSLMFLSLAGCAHTVSETPRAIARADQDIYRVLSIPGDRGESETAERVIYELGTRFMLLLLSQNGELKDKVLWLATENTPGEEPPPELIESLHDLPVEIRPISTFKVIKIKRGNTTLIGPQPRITVRIVTWVSETEVRISACGYCGPLSGLSYDTTVKWEDGTWILIEPNVVGVR